MAVTPISAFTVDASVTLAVGGVSSNVALPGTLADDTVVRVANIGPYAIAVALGGSTVKASFQPGSGLTVGVVVPGGTVQYLALGSATYIAAVSQGQNSTLGVSTGN